MITVTARPRAPLVSSASRKETNWICRRLSSSRTSRVYASEHEERIFFHTCKSRACPSCGHWATIRWQRERWVALPDVSYKGITFTMPDVLWKLFKDNRILANVLPAIAASAMESWVYARHGVRIGITAILHTFNERLEFNSHVHTMVSAGGLQVSSGSWASSVFYGNDQLMQL